MNPVPLVLPVRATEAVALAEIVFQISAGRKLTDEIRNRIASRLNSLGLTSAMIHAGSLARDPTHTEAYYVAVDGLGEGASRPLLLHLSLASSPSSALFKNPLLIARMRPVGSPEIVVNAIPFGPGDQEQIRTFIGQIDRAFLPRPQGPLPAIVVDEIQPELTLPAAFDAFRVILKTMGVNLAAVRGLPTAFWAAIRAGWRDGYTAEAGRITVSGGDEEEIARSLESANREIERAAGYTKFVVDARVLSHAGEEERLSLPGDFANPFQVGERTYSFSSAEIQSLARRFGSLLNTCEVLHDYIRRVKAATPFGRAFDFEIAIGSGDTPTTPPEVLFCLHWLKLRGKPVHCVEPNLGSLAGEALGAHVAELASAARLFNSALTISSGRGHSAEELNLIGRATSSRVNYRISAIPGARLSETEKEAHQRISRHIVWLAQNLRS